MRVGSGVFRRSSFVLRLTSLVVLAALVVGLFIFWRSGLAERRRGHPFGSAQGRPGLVLPERGQAGPESAAADRGNGLATQGRDALATKGYTGSVSCRQCHEEFYKLWSMSHHGLAMQPYTSEFAARELQPLSEPVRIGEYEYSVELGSRGGLMLASKVSLASRVEGVPSTSLGTGPPSNRGQDARDTLPATRLQTGPKESTAYEIAHALGGRNVYYFLTPMERGRLQVLPLAYDVRRKEWFETAMSALRHFPGSEADAPLEWTDPFYTFNTSCYGCHVSQLSTNYDPATDTYHTTWAEPGINCETCHGPGGEHVETFLAAASEAGRVGLGPPTARWWGKPRGEGVPPSNRGQDARDTSVGPAPPIDDGGATRSTSLRARPEPAEGAGSTLRSEPADLKLVSARNFTVEQTNSQCASCHAKLSRVSPAFEPGQLYFDHFDLVTLEHQDFYPDGRDLGENYTYTSWRMSPCVKSGQLDCMHCHTSSGRYRFVGPGPANDVCLPCHAERVANATEHTHHAADSEGNKCVACHMPTTEFARMTRSDHSMRPPAPAATLAFKSPNACNLCHVDKDAAWADTIVREWHEDDYQQPILEVGNLVRAARTTRDDRRGTRDERREENILGYIARPDRDEVVATSLIRLLRGSDSEQKWPVIIGALENDPSPLVRAAAAEVLDGLMTDPSLKALLAATRDEFRLIRVRAAASLASRVEGVPSTSLGTGPPSNRGPEARDTLADSDRQALAAATAELEAALRARPDDYVSNYNLGNFHIDRREYERAISAFEAAIKLRADYVPPYVNASLAFNAIGRNAEAEASLKAAIAIDPNSVAAHLNLGMLLAELGRMADAEASFRDALSIDPNSAVAAYNLGIILAEDRTPEALEWCSKAAMLQPDNPRYVYTYAFYLRQSGSEEQAVRVLRGLTGKQVPYVEAYLLLGDIYEKQQQFSKARDVYSTALRLTGLSEQQRYAFAARIRQIEGR